MRLPSDTTTTFASSFTTSLDTLTKSTKLKHQWPQRPPEDAKLIWFKAKYGEAIATTRDLCNDRRFSDHVEEESKNLVHGKKGIP